MNLVWGIFGGLLGLAWLWRGVEVAFGIKRVAEITEPQWDRYPSSRVTIIVPAKDEGESIEQCLSSLLRLEYDSYEIVAVDDRSEDQTGAIMDRLAEQNPDRLKVIHLNEVPPGWLGKTHAMWKGAQDASSEWILFTDGDVLFRRDSLRRAVGYAEKTGADHLVLFPSLIMNGPGERMMLSSFQAMFSLWQRPWRVQDPKSRDYLGAGAFSLIRRDAYQQVGTYLALRLEVLDDMMLGKAVKDHGLTQHCVFGRDLIRLRWAKGTFGVVNNLTKNLFSLLQFNWLRALMAACVLAIFNLGIPFGIVFAPGVTKAGFVLAFGIIATLYFGMSKRVVLSPGYFLLYPVAASLFIFAIFRSMIVTLRRGGVVWRGTKYPLEQLRAASAEPD
jgi:glycosyltransferase involved in cell wall biosynthesis